MLIAFKSWKIMKRIFVFALPLLLLFVGCKDQDGPQPRVTGHILAGETGPGIISEEFPDGIQLVGGAASGFQYEVLLDSALGYKLDYNTSQYSGSSSGVSYNHGTSSVVSSPIAVEIAFAEVVDTIWHCEEWNLDSTDGHIYHYNRAAGTFCQNPSTFEVLDTLQYPIGHAFGDTIHSGSPWASDRFDFAFYHSDLEVQYDSARTVIDDRKTRADHWQNLGRRYVAFRWKNAGIWKYGYVEVEVVGDHILKIFGYGVEG